MPTCAVIFVIYFKFYNRINPVTRKEEPYLPPKTKAIRVIGAYSFVVLMVNIIVLKCILNENNIRIKQMVEMR